jgi:hypothetical protein
MNLLRVVIQREDPEDPLLQRRRFEDRREGEMGLLGGRMQIEE